MLNFKQFFATIKEVAVKARVIIFEHDEDNKTNLNQSISELLEQLRSGYEVVLYSSPKYNNLFYLYVSELIYKPVETFKKFEQFLKKNFPGVGFLWMDNFKAFYVAENNSAKNIKSPLYHKLREFEFED